MTLWQDRIETYYINLEHRTDRRELLEKELATTGFTRWTRFEGIRLERGDVGCSTSHLKVLELALEKLSEDTDYVLVFEDDFQFVVSPKEFHERMQRFVEASKVDACMISFAHEVDDEGHNDLGPGFQRIRFAQTASGYLVHRDYLSTLINLYRTSVPLLESTGQHWVFMNDQVWRHLMEKDMWYRFSERMGIQRESYSDVSRAVVNYQK